jgi:hypothetical protein
LARERPYSQTGKELPYLTTLSEANEKKPPPVKAPLRAAQRSCAATWKGSS